MAVEKFESDRESLVHGATRVRGTRQRSWRPVEAANVIDDLVAHGWHGSASAEFTQVMSRWDTNANKLTTRWRTSRSCSTTAALSSP